MSHLVTRTGFRGVPHVPHCIHVDRCICYPALFPSPLNVKVSHVRTDPKEPGVSWRESHLLILGRVCWLWGRTWGPDVGGCPRRSGHSTAPSPLGALTFLDVNILSILPVMEGSARPCLRFPGWRTAEAHVVLSMTLHLLGEPFNTVYSNSHKESIFVKPAYRLWGLKIRTRPEHKSIHHRVLCRCKNTEPNEKPPQCPQVGTNLSHYDSLTRKTAV